MRLAMMRGLSPLAIPTSPSTNISRWVVRVTMCAPSFLAIGEHKVGEADAVDRGDEGDRDAGAQPRRVGEVLHHVDQPHHRAQDADRRGITAGRLPDARRHFQLVLHADLDLEYLAQPIGLDSVDQQPALLRMKGRAMPRSGSPGSRPSLRAVWPQFATCSMIVSKAGAGGTKTQRAMRMP